MSVPRTHDSSCDITVQPTVSALHIPASHTFIPFQQFSISDGTGLRNPADDNNNKATMPVVSVVAAVSGLCPAIPVVSMQQSAQLAQAVVASTIIPTVVTPMAVQTANCLPPTTTMAVATNTLNISGHISLPVQQQQQTVGIAGINLSPQVSGKVITASSNTANVASAHQNTPSSPGNKSTNSSSTNSNSSSPPSNSSSINPVKPNISTSKSSSSQAGGSEQNEDLVKPVFKDGELVLEVECGQNKAILYLSKLCQGSKGPCISFQNSWLTPNEFQFVSGRETAKDWKRSIRHHGKSLKLLLAKGILNVHPTMCDCDGCRQGATLTRKGEKRRIPNSERKPRKANSNHNQGSGDGTTSGAFRPIGGSAMVAQLTAQGAAQPKQAKPEAKRSAGDKSKMTDAAAHQSLQKEANASLSSKQGLSVKSTSTQRPTSLITCTEPGQKRTSSTSSAPTSPESSVPTAPAAAAVTPTTVPVQPSIKIPPTVPLQPSAAAAITPTAQANLSSASHAGPVQVVNISSAPPTSTRVPSYPSIASTSVSPASSTQTVSGQYSVPTPSVRALPAAVTAANQLSEYPTSCADMSQISNSSLPSNGQANQQSVPTVSHRSLEESRDDDTKPYDEEDVFAGHESDESQNIDEKSDVMDDESDDEQSDDSSENNDSISSDQKIDTVCHEVKTYDAQAQVQHSNFISDGTSGESLHVKQDAEDFQKSTEQTHVLEDPVTDPAVEDKQGLLPEPESSPSVAPPALTTTTLALTGFSSACTQPLSVSISTTNIKSEQIWVPPTLSPPTDAHHVHRLKHVSSNIKHVTDAAVHADSGHFKGLDNMSSTPSKDAEKRSMARKLERPSQMKIGGISGPKPDTLMPGSTQCKDIHSLHLTQSTQAEREAAKRDFNEADVAKPVYIDHVLSNEKNSREEEREERFKQRVKEERNKREREDRNRKDREREERRERERREEKETERRRHEEKERREFAKAQTESSSSKDISTPGPTMDPSRRPPGGVAEAAAFSDYMRVLAAGHGHTFIPPTLSYMPSIFPVRHPETSIPSHLLHPMSTFGPQLNGVPKDPMLYQTPGGVLSNYAASPFGPLHPLLQRPQYTTQQSLLDYQRSLTAVSYPWPAAYPYFIPDVAASSANSAASSSNSSASLAAGVKRPTSEMEAALELSAKRMRLEGRAPEYSSPWDYFAAAAVASQNQRLSSLSASLPCGLESTSVDKTWEYLRKRYLEYSPQTAAYLSALPEYARPMYHCACADHREENIRMWNVEDVCKFLNSLDGCSVYADHFREQRVTGRILALLTTDHLVKSLGMKLGPALLLAEAVAKKLQESNKISNCEACRSMALSQPMHAMAMPL